MHAMRPKNKKNNNNNIRNESVPKIIINDTIYFLNCNQQFGKFKL